MQVLEPLLALEDLLQALHQDERYRAYTYLYTDDFYLVVRIFDASIRISQKLILTRETWSSSWFGPPWNDFILIDTCFQPLSPLRGCRQVWLSHSGGRNDGV